MNTLLALVIPSMLLVPTMGLLSAVKHSGGLGHELRRKGLHVGTGLVALAFPSYLTERWMVLIALGLVLAWLAAARLSAPLRRRFGACLHDSRRHSHGELYFALGVAILMFLAAETPLLYVIPLLILTLADAAAAIVGRGMPVGRLRGPMTGKTLSGCVAFFVVAFLCTALCLLAFTSLAMPHTILVATAVATTTGAAEALCRRGLDNVVVPVVAYFTLLPFALDTVANRTGA